MAHMVQGISLNTSFCSQARMATDECRLCVTVCPVGAIEIRKRRPQLDPNRCSGCGACVAECPTGALDVERLEPELTGLLEPPVPVIGCRTEGAGPAHARVRCLGILSIDHLLGLSALGKERVELDATICEGCSCAEGVEAVARRLELLRSHVDRNLPVHIVDRGTPRYEPTRYGRRAFFGSLRREAIQRLAAWEDMATGPEGGKRPPMGRRWARELARGLDGPAAEKLTRDLIPTLSLTPECDDCLGCVGMCPTGALRASVEVVDRRLRIDTWSCSSCGLCIAFCPRDAIAVVAPVGRSPNLVPTERAS